MAKQRKMLPARRPRNAANGSMLIRSAESLGRVIGSLQRQLDAARQLTVRATDGSARGNGQASPPRSGAATGASNGRKRSEPSKAENRQSMSDRKSKRASKAALATKAGARRRSGAKQRAAKSGGA